MTERSYAFSEIVDRLSDEIDFEFLTQFTDGASQVVSEDIHRPGMGLMGYTDGFHHERIQILGRTECGYLDTLDEGAQLDAIRRILELSIPGIFVANSSQLPKGAIAEAERARTPIVRCALKANELTERVRDLMQELFAPRKTLHGTLVDVYGVGLLLTGRSGIGKSETALDLVERGHRLVADDLVQVVRRSNDVIVGTRREGIGHVMEIRGAGIVDLMPTFGVRAIRMQKRIEVEIQLTDWDDNATYDRHGLDRQTTEILGVTIPQLVVPIVAGKNSTVIAEFIALDFMLKTYGIDSAREFNEKLIETMMESGNTARYLKHDTE